MTKATVTPDAENAIGDIAGRYGLSLTFRLYKRRGEHGIGAVPMRP